MADLTELQSAGAMKIVGSDATGVETNFADVNTDGSVKVAGTGTAGTPSSNVLTVQGITSGTPIPVSGTVTGLNESVSTEGSAVPAKATYIAGTDGTNLQGLSTDTAGTLNTTSRANTSGLYGSLTVGTTAVQVKVGGSNLANRKLVIIHNNSGNTMYWGFNNSVTTSNGVVLFRDQTVSIPVGAGIDIYIISGSSSQNSRIAELA